MDEPSKITERYARRRGRAHGSIYDPMNPSVYMADQERERALIQMLRRIELMPIRDTRVLEIGCGGGRNLLQLIRLGFRPDHLVGNDLLPERAAEARGVLPPTTVVLEGDTLLLDEPASTFDIVYQSLVFSSILDDRFQERLAQRMWAYTKPGGGVLWYDFAVSNPYNPDVRGVPVERIRELFPSAELISHRVTLAPPISRRVTRIHPSLYTVFNALPLLRTHVLCWIAKAT